MTTKTAREIRAEAWRALGEKQYWTYVAAYLLLALLFLVMIIPIFMVMGAGIGISGILPFLQPGAHPEIGILTDMSIMLPLLSSALIASILLIYPVGFLCWGNAAMAIATMRRGLKFGHAFAGWGHGWKMGWIVMVKVTYITLWSLLLYIPGLIKTFSYAMTDFIAVDHPDWTANQCITESRRMMDGHKWRYFCLNLSFIGWFLLLFVAHAVLFMVPMVSGMLNYLLMPYVESAKAAFYEDLLDRMDTVAEARGSAEVSDYAAAFERGTVV